MTNAQTTTAKTPADESPWIETFIAGTHTDANGNKITVTEAHLDDLVESYDPAKHEAPVVVGHPKTNDPALGWVAALKRVGQKLFYREKGVLPEFEEMRAAGNYKKRSLSFYLPTSPGNPTPGKLHIRHVGWLGAMPPGIKGLADKASAAAFSESDGEGVVEFNDLPEFSDEYRVSWAFRALAALFGRMRDRIIETDGTEIADRIVPSYEIDSLREAGLIRDDTNSSMFSEDTNPDDSNLSPEEQAAMTKAADELAAAQEQLKKDQEALDAQRAELAEQQKKAADERASAARQGAVEYADALVAGGKLAPSARNSVVELLLSVDTSPALNFSEAEGADPTEKPAGDVLRTILNGLPKQFDFSEKSGDKGEAVDLTDPDALAAAAVEFAESEKKAGREISVAAAVKHVVKKGAK